MRCFIAIELPGQVKDELAGVLKRMQSGARDPNLTRMVKWVDSGQIHITLKFLGEVPEGRLDELIGTVRAATDGRKAFELKITGTGTFPGWTSPRVIWVGLAANERDPLADAARAVDLACETMGFARETRPFSAHLTLGRVREWVSPAEKRVLGEALRVVDGPKPISFEVRTISLMRSQLSPKGSIYTRLAEFPLG